MLIKWGLGMTRAQINALDSAAYLAGQSLLAPTVDDANEYAALAGEWLAVVIGKPVKATPDNVHGLIAQLKQSGTCDL